MAKIGGGFAWQNFAVGNYCGFFFPFALDGTGS